MHLQIDKEIFAQHQDLKVGVILVKGIDNSKRNSSVESLLRGICAQRHKQFAEKEISDEKNVQVWEQAYGKFGINPKKFAPSIAALLKRVKSGKEIPHISALVDLYNYFSLKFLLPIGGEDLDWLCGDLHLTFTKGGEAFRPIGSIDVDEAGEGEVCYKDKGGITCRYWNHRECERTKFTQKTVNAAIFIEDLSKMHMDEFGKVLKEIEDGIRKYIGGQLEVYVLTEERPSLDLGIEGRKMAKDAVVPKQEQAFFEKIQAEKQTDESPESPEPKPKAKPKPQEPEAPLFYEDETILIKQVEAIMKEALAATFDIEKEIKIEYPSNDEYGDYACNIALQLSKELGKNPREIAEEILKNIPKSELIDRTEIAGPGFINFFLSEKTLTSELAEILQKKDNYGQLALGKDEPVIVEYSAPNIAKPLGVHHLLSTIIGQTVFNIMQKVGFHTISINHIGDWGTQFGKLICAYKKWGDKATLEADPVNELLKLYVKFHNEAETDPSLEDEGRREFKAFEDGDKENRELWEWFREESLKDIKKTYEALGGIEFEHYHGESFYEDKMAPILEDGKKKGIFVEGEEGAYVSMFDDPDMPPFVVQKKDGATLYSTRDFAALKYRIETFKPKKIIYAVDIAQTLHFKQLFETAKKFDWYGGEGEHIWFGRMHMKDSNMSTRKGNIILLDEVILEAQARAKKIIEEKSPHLADIDKVAHVIGVGAIKYNVLSQNRTTDITFDWDKMLSLDGNSGPYLQYSYARGRSILRKASQPIDSPGQEDSTSSTDTSSNENTEQIKDKTASLTRALTKYKEAIIHSAHERKPNIISNYLYDLAQKFNSFYNSVPVMKADQEAKEERLQLVEAAAQVIKNGLLLLGVEVVEEM